MKTYRAVRTAGGCVFTVDDDGEVRPLNMRFDLRNHSPCGGEFGYGGSGPAQASLAILADAIGDERAQRLYQRFKFRHVATVSGDRFEMTEQQVLDAVERLEAERREER